MLLDILTDILAPILVIWLRFFIFYFIFKPWLKSACLSQCHILVHVAHIGFLPCYMLSVYFLFFELTLMILGNFCDCSCARSSLNHALWNAFTGWFVCYHVGLSPISIRLYKNCILIECLVYVPLGLHVMTMEMVALIN